MTLPDPSNAAEFIDDEGHRYAWSESNVRYEEVEPDDGCFTLLRNRLSKAQERLEEATRILQELYDDFTFQDVFGESNIGADIHIFLSEE